MAADTDGDGAASYDELAALAGDGADETFDIMLEVFAWADAAYGNRDEKFTAEEVMTGLGEF